MKIKHFSFITSMVTFFFVFQQISYSQTQNFSGPFNQDYCIGAGSVEVFEATYINDIGSPVAPASFTFTNSAATPNDIATLTFATVPSLNSGATSSGLTTVGLISGASYSMSITNVGVNNYVVRLFITSGIITSMNGYSYECSASDGFGTSSSAATLTVASPINISIVSPATLMVTACETENVTIDASTSAVPDSWEWKNTTTNMVAGTSEDLTLATATLAQSGNYVLEINDTGCPAVFSNPVSVLIVPEVDITDTDMTAKELAPGDTKTFTATADNIDGSSIYTWLVNSMPFTSAGLPTTIMVNGNSIQVNSISNVGMGPTTIASTLSLTNMSMPGVPYYTAPIGLTVSNNAACVATTTTLMSGATTIFPVEWNYFSAQQMDEKDVLLDWETATETNNEQFIIERSLDGKTFKERGSVRGSGTSFQKNKYSWKDNDLPSVETLLYRLRQIDFDGNESFSETKVVRLEKTNQLDVKVVSLGMATTSLLIHTPEEGNAEIVIFDARGVQIVKSSVVLYQGSQTISLPNLNVRGVYFLQLRMNELDVSTVFVK